MTNRMTLGAATALGVGIGTALAASMGPAGLALGAALGLGFWGVGRNRGNK